MDIKDRKTTIFIEKNHSRIAGRARGQGLALSMAALALALGGCGQGSQSSNNAGACQGVTCSGQGTCSVNGQGNAVCKCNPGYKNASGNSCIPENAIDPCQGKTCSAPVGVCIVDPLGNPECSCNAGYQPGPNFTCQPGSGGNVCQGQTCSNNGTCVVDPFGAPECQCNTGYHPGPNLTCEGNCDGVNCSNNGTCSLNGSGNPVCTCNAGYQRGTDPTTCVPLPGSTTGPCAGVTCSGRGTCVANPDGSRACQCQNGYEQSVDSPISCVAVNETDVCFEMNCGQGSCGPDATDPSVPMCTCNPGYFDDEGLCIVDEAGPCLEKCGEFGFCYIIQGNATCNCDPGYVLDNTDTCVPQN